MIGCWALSSAPEARPLRWRALLRGSGRWRPTAWRMWTWAPAGTTLWMVRLPFDLRPSLLSPPARRAGATCRPVPHPHTHTPAFPSRGASQRPHSPSAPRSAAGHEQYSSNLQRIMQVVELGSAAMHCRAPPKCPRCSSTAGFEAGRSQALGGGNHHSPPAHLRTPPGAQPTQPRVWSPPQAAPSDGAENSGTRRRSAAVRCRSCGACLCTFTP